MLLGNSFYKKWTEPRMVWLKLEGEREGVGEREMISPLRFGVWEV
jgi:hypothetical protein